VWEAGMGIIGGVGGLGKAGRVGGLRIMLRIMLN